MGMGTKRTRGVCGGRPMRPEEDTEISRSYITEGEPPKRSGAMAGKKTMRLPGEEGREAC